MENFKIKSIDEFDLDFVAKYNEAKPQIASEESADSLNIDDLSPDLNNNSAAIEPAVINEQPVAPIINQPQQTPPPPAPAVKPEQPQKAEVKEKPKKAKQSGLAIAGKIIATIMLVMTVISFVFGCFISVFLDNKNIDLGINLNTINSDIVIQTQNKDGLFEDTKIFSKGDLVISKKVDHSEYPEVFNEATDYIFITYSPNPDNEDSYSDVYLLTDVLSATDSNAVLNTKNLSTGNIETAEINTEDKSYHGMITSYIPALGGIIHFASSFGILVSVLFILLAAFWCLVLVLIDNQRYKTKKNKK